MGHCLALLCELLFVHSGVLYSSVCPAAQCAAATSNYKMWQSLGFAAQFLIGVLLTGPTLSSGSGWQPCKVNGDTMAQFRLKVVLLDAKCSCGFGCFFSVLLTFFF